jgi:acetyl-CoA carboxylase biotin carboxyl carrier protein
MTQDEVKELIELVAAKGFAEFEIERSDFKLRIVASVAPPAVAPFAQQQISAAPAVGAVPVAPPVAAPVEAAPAAPPPPVADEDLFVVTSPLVGTFYRSPGPAAEPFVKMGDNVDVGAVLCIVEAMKLMNEIEAERAGEVVKVFVENGQPVEYGQPLFGIRV